MNACAHYLHILYFLLGDTMSTSAMPETVEGILCRANPIETFDTAMLRVRAAGAVLDFSATHACDKKIDPLLAFEFENAHVEMVETGKANSIRAFFKDGTMKDYGDIRSDYFNKIPYCCDILRKNQPPICTVETALPHLKTVNAVTELLPVMELKSHKNENAVSVVPGLDELLEKAFQESKMP